MIEWTELGRIRVRAGEWDQRRPGFSLALLQGCVLDQITWLLWTSVFPSVNERCGLGGPEVLCASAFPISIPKGLFRAQNHVLSPHMQPQKGQVCLKEHSHPRPIPVSTGLGQAGATETQQGARLCLATVGGPSQGGVPGCPED